MMKPPRKEFDVAVVNLVLHHIDDTSSFLKGSTGLLKPGGWVVITEFAVEDGEKDFRLSGDLHEEIKHGKVRPEPSPRLDFSSTRLSFPRHTHSISPIAQGPKLR